MKRKHSDLENVPITVTLCLTYFPNMLTLALAEQRSERPPLRKKCPNEGKYRPK